jgi:thiosulfate/3-mercaptopyruvate sulfurtransferase
MEAGIDGSSLVVIANSEGGAQYHVSARVAFTLKYAGIENVAILDGGMAVWTKAGKPVAAGTERRKETNYTPTARPEYLASQDYVVANIGKTQFIDVRTYDGYFGRTKFANAVQFGHIPGAVAAPKEWLYDADGKLVPAAQIKELFAALEIDSSKEIIGYCDTGMGCSILWWVFKEQFGWENIKMYDGSSEELSRNPKVTFTKYTWR